MSNVKIRLLSGLEKPSVIIDGEEVADKISSVIMSACQNNIPIVTLGLQSEVDIEIDGVVQTEKSGDSRYREALTRIYEMLKNSNAGLLSLEGKIKKIVSDVLNEAPGDK